MPINNEKYSALILAGGMSERMGFPKPWLKTNEGISFTKHIINTYKIAGINDIVIVLNNLFANSFWKKEIDIINNHAKIVLNYNSELGRLYTLKSGLPYCKHNNVFIHNIDIPFVSDTTLKVLKNQFYDADVIIPTYNNKGGHPILINSSVKKRLSENQVFHQTLKELISTYQIKKINISDTAILTNINTHSQYLKALHELV